jgi:hypothetical protein
MTSNAPVKSSSSPLRNPLWLWIGFILFLLVMALLFFVLASSALQHDLQEPLPPSAVPADPSPVVPH